MTTESIEPRDATAREPRYARTIAALIFIGAAFTLAYPALGGMFLINPDSDQYIAGFAFREFAAQSLKSGEGFPLWNPYLYGGMPYIAAMHGDIFYPTFLLRFILPTDVAMTWGFIIHVILAGYFSFLFLRCLGLSYWASVIGGLAYMLGGNVAGLVSPGHDGKLFISALLPIALYLLARFVRDGRLWAWGLLALVVGLAVLSPHPQLLQYMLLTGAGFALFVAFADPNAPKLERRIAATRLVVALGAVALGFLIGAVQYLPVLEYVDWSPRAGGKQGWEHAISYSMPPEELINTYLPQFTGILDNYSGRNLIHFHSEYIGAAVMMLAGLAWSRRLSPAHRRIMWWGSITLIVATFWALGGFTPFYRVIYAIVPGTKFFRAPSTMLYVVQFSMAVLAALGAERAIRADVTRRYVIGWGVAAVVIAALATTGALTNLAVSFSDERLTDSALANKGALVGGAWRSALMIGLLAGVLILAARQRLTVLQTAISIGLIVLLDLWSIERHYWRWSAPGSVTFAANDITRYLNGLDQPVRVIAAPLAPLPVKRDPFLGSGAFYGGDALMVHRIRSPLGYHGNQLDRYDIIAGRDAGYQNIANPAFWAVSNTQFFLTNTDSLPLPGVTRVMGPVASPVNTQLYLYRLPGDNVFSWVTPVIVQADDESVTATLLHPGFDVRRAALFPPDAQVNAQQIQALPEPLSIVTRTSEYRPGHYVVELSAPAPAGAALIVSENFYPGWTASVDGNAVPVWRADMSLQGVELPAGARRVEFNFESRPYETGRLVTLIALVFSLGAWAAGAVFTRRRGGATTQ